MTSDPRWDEAEASLRASLDERPDDPTLLRELAALERETRRRFSERHPAPEALASFDLWDAFEAEDPRTFRGMYQFWVQKPV